MENIELIFRAISLCFTFVSLSAVPWFMGYTRLTYCTLLSIHVFLNILIVLALAVYSFNPGPYDFTMTVSFLFFDFPVNVFINGVSLIFLTLTITLIPVALFASSKVTSREFIVLSFLFFGLEFFLIMAFLVKNLLVFYFFFEATLVPMFVLIECWGSQLRRVYAAYSFYIYTLLGSVFMLLAIAFVYAYTGTLDMNQLSEMRIERGLNFFPLYLIWFSFFIGFAVKVPMVPFHLWLPEAHVEAPTGGSVVLAGILLKLGLYGFIRVLLGILPSTTYYFSDFIFVLALISIVQASLIALRQVDMKRLIAYTSIVHMNLVLLGLFSFDLIGNIGSVYLFVAHSYVSTAMFFLVGCLYDRYGSRIISVYGGLDQVLPKLGRFFFLFCLANMAFPPSLNFLGEILIFMSLAEAHYFVLIVALFSSIVLGSAYTIWLFNRVAWGPLPLLIRNYIDIDKREFWILFGLIFITFCLGILPQPLNNLVENDFAYLLTLVEYNPTVTN